MAQSTPTPSSTTTFTTPLAGGEGVTDAGIESVGGWASNPNAPPPGYWTPLPVQVLEQIPAPVNVQLPLTDGVTRVGSPQQYRVTLSLSGAHSLPTSITLAPTAANSQNSPVLAVAPNVFVYQFRSRQELVVTLSTEPNDYAATAVLTAVALGGAEVQITIPRACNLPFTNASPSGTEGSQAVLQVTVVA